MALVSPSPALPPGVTPSSSPTPELTPSPAATSNPRLPGQRVPPPVRQVPYPLPLPTPPLAAPRRRGGETILLPRVSLVVARTFMFGGRQRELQMSMAGRRWIVAVGARRGSDMSFAHVGRYLRTSGESVSTVSRHLIGRPPVG